MSVSQALGANFQQVMSPAGCQGMSKTRSVLDIQVPAELWQIYEGPLKGNISLNQETRLLPIITNEERSDKLDKGI